MKNTSDTAYILMTLTFILSMQMTSETAKILTIVAGIMWGITGILRMFKS